MLMMKGGFHPLLRSGSPNLEREIAPIETNSSTFENDFAEPFEATRFDASRLMRSQTWPKGNRVGVRSACRWALAR